MKPQSVNSHSGFELSDPVIVTNEKGNYLMSGKIYSLTTGGKLQNHNEELTITVYSSEKGLECYPASQVINERIKKKRITEGVGIWYDSKERDNDGFPLSSGYIEIPQLYPVQLGEELSKLLNTKDKTCKYTPRWMPSYEVIEADNQKLNLQSKKVDFQFIENLQEFIGVTDKNNKVLVTIDYKTGLLEVPNMLSFENETKWLNHNNNEKFHIFLGVDLLFV
jgi:hypothetical protein